MKSHEWATLEGNIATVGISDYAQVRRMKYTRTSYIKGLLWAMNVWPYCGGTAVVRCKHAVKTHQMLLKIGKLSLKTI